MDSTTTNAAGTRKNRHGGSIRVFPTDGGTGHRVTTGIHHRTEVKRNLEASYRAQWTKEMKTQLEQDQARMLVIVQELNAAQAKAQPDIERSRENLETKIHRSLKDRAIAAQGMLNAIDDGDMTRLQRSQRARDAVGSGDPDQILATVLAHLTAISGQETRGDVVYHLKELTQASSAAKGDGVFEHLNIFRDAVEVSRVLLGSLPVSRLKKRRNFKKSLRPSSPFCAVRRPPVLPNPRRPRLRWRRRLPGWWPAPPTHFLSSVTTTKARTTPKLLCSAAVCRDSVMECNRVD